MRRVGPAALRSLLPAAGAYSTTPRGCCCCGAGASGARSRSLSSAVVAILVASKSTPFPTKSPLSFAAFRTLALASARIFSTSTHSPPRPRPDEATDDEAEKESAVEWEEEEEDIEPMIGDGGNGGGVVLGDVGWGKQALSACREVLDEHFGNDIVMYAFKVSPRGYVYVRLDKLTNKYGCPGIEEIESFSNLYKQRLDQIVESGEIPLDLALEVSSPGAERLLKVPEDLVRFKDMPMRVQYLEENPNIKQHQPKEGVFSLESTDTDSGHSVWKLANVKENRAEAGKGRPMNRKQKDWRLRVRFEEIKRVMLYLYSKH